MEQNFPSLSRLLHLEVSPWTWVGRHQCHLSDELWQIQGLQVHFNCMQISVAYIFFSFSVTNLIQNHVIWTSLVLQSYSTISPSPSQSYRRLELSQPWSASMPAPAEITDLLQQRLTAVNGQICWVHQRLDKTSLDILDWNLILFLD